ncbi:MAG: alpha/beta hydrolase [Hylemonella sp.]|nr:alpha/beta hydrolase [Hylemonella sp.]
MTPSAVLLLPGWQNSGELHWQSLWERLHGYRRVQQHDWMRPLRGDWLVQLEEAVLACGEPAILVAHSLGCIQVAAWAAHSRSAHRVKGALLVAPGDVEREDLRAQLPGWSPIAREPLPFSSMLVASHDDPYCSFARAQSMARDWGAELTDLGRAGHINADSGLGDWPQGQELLRQLQQLN